ncbi:MAG: hypothetical protein K6E51_10985, partial [Treponema sp.]|nr:hypothetical protein [Treponema sp.]
MKLCDQIEVLIEPPVNPDTITPFAARELSTGLAQTSYAEFQKLFTPAEDSDVKVITNTWTSSLHHPSYGETNGALCEVVNN